jgi:CcmD family protein
MSLLNLQDVEMADAFRSDGKIYVVVAVISVVVMGLIAYLFSIDKKVSKLEKEVKK